MTLSRSDIRHAVIRAGLSGRITVINGAPVVWRGAWRHNRHMPLQEPCPTCGAMNRVDCLDACIRCGMKW